MSAIAGAKVLEAAESGELIEPGLVEDSEGNPVTDMTVLGDFDKNIRIVIKDGKIFKNTL